MYTPAGCARAPDQYPRLRRVRTTRIRYEIGGFVYDTVNVYLPDHIIDHIRIYKVYNLSRETESLNTSIPSAYTAVGRIQLI